LTVSVRKVDVNLNLEMFQVVDLEGGDVLFSSQVVLSNVSDDDGGTNRRLINSLLYAFCSSFNLAWFFGLLMPDV